MFTGKGMLHLVSGQEQRAKELLQKEMGGGLVSGGGHCRPSTNRGPEGLRNIPLVLITQS